MNPIDFGGQRSKVKVTIDIYGYKLVNTIKTEPFVCLFIKLGRHDYYDKRINPIDFGGKRSKVKVTIDIYGNRLVNTIKTEPLCASSSNLADMFTMTRG